MEFAPKTDLEVEVLNYFTTLHPTRISVERLVSGAGIVSLYDFFALKYPEKINESIQNEVNNIIRFYY